MLKPINSMEARLERVEQQVELLAKNSHCPSCLGFDPNPRSTTSEDAQLCDEFELIKKGNGTSEPPEEDTFVTTNTFVPKSPCCDEKEEANDVLESPKKEQPKETISIDDALAAALAGNSVTSRNDVSMKILDNSFHLQGKSEVEMDPITYLRCPSPCDNYKTNAHKVVKILTFNKTDILKHFPAEQVATSSNGGEVNDTVDYESPILEVKFTSFDNGSHKSHLEALLSNTDDHAGATDGVINVSAVEVNTTNGNNLLVDFDDVCVGEGVRVQPLSNLKHLSQVSFDN